MCVCLSLPLSLYLMHCVIWWIDAILCKVVGQYVQVAAEATTQQGAITVGQALEATMQTIGDKPVELSDAAAIREAEMRATGSNIVTQGGYAASAQSAAAYNTGMIGDEDKIKLRDVLAVTSLLNNLSSK